MTKNIYDFRVEDGLGEWGAHSMGSGQCRSFLGCLDLPDSLIYLFSPWHYLIPLKVVPATMHYPGLFWRKIMCWVTFQQCIAKDILSFLYPRFTPDNWWPYPLKSLGKIQIHWLDTKWVREREREEGERKRKRGKKTDAGAVFDFVCEYKKE